MGSGDSVPEYTTYSGGLGGWPLPTMADGDALHITRTKAFSAVEGQKTLGRRRLSLLSSISIKHRKQIAILLPAVRLEAQKAGSPFKVFQPSQTQEIT